MNTQLVKKQKNQKTNKKKTLNDGVKINLSVSHMLNIHHIVYAAVSQNAVSIFFNIKQITSLFLDTELCTLYA